MKKFAIALEVALLGVLSGVAAADQAVYDGQLENGWTSWSWASVNFSVTNPVYQDKYSIEVSETGAYQAIYLHNNPQTSSGFEGLRFWVNGGKSGGQTGLTVQATINGGAQVSYPLPPLPANKWIEVTVPMVGVGVGSVNDFDGFWIIDNSGKTQPAYYLDAISLVNKPSAVSSQPIYNGILENQWTNASTAQTNFSGSGPNNSGHAITVTPESATQYFELSHPALDGSEYQTLTFMISGGSAGGQQLVLSALCSGVSQTPYALPKLAKNTWTTVTVPLQSLGVSARGDLDGIMLSNANSAVAASYDLAAITLSVTPITNALANITVSTANKTPISPFIYGVNSTDWAGMGKGFTMSRQGGNRLEAYNWENNASNAGSDWIFQNDDLMGATNQAGWAGTNFIAQALAGNAMPLLTVQMMGLVAADKNPPGNVNQTPNYLNVRFKKVQAAKPSGQYVYPPDTSDDYVYMDEFVHYIKQFASPKFPLMFDLDNEPDLWASTFSEVHPNAPTYAEELSDSIATSSSVKRVYPEALIFGPVSYGWEGYRSFQGAPDANGRDFLAFYLAGMAGASKKAGKRLLDVLDLHWYPEATGDGFRITGDGDSLGLADARVQASRSLFDPTYVENSWITQSIGNKPIDLIPSTQSIINSNYPNTNLSFTEYNYGGGNTISGAIAQADVLGVFGRYGVYAASNWGLGATETSELAGFQAFINYDRAGSKFGDLSLNVSGTNAANNAVYAALDSTNSKRMTVVVINKTIGITPFAINLNGFTVNSTKAYTIVAGHYATPLTTAVINLTDAVSLSAPPLSVTTIELISK